MEWISWHTTENASWFFVLHLRNICRTEANGKDRRGQTRRDSKRRVLRPGESVRADGKYQYKYHIDGKPHFVYSWKLESTDKLPKGKKPCLSLRKLEKQVNTDLDLLVNIVDVSVFEGLVWESGIIPVSCVTTLSEGEKVWKKVEKSIDGYSGFLFYDDNGMPLVAMHWQHRFNHMVGRYNDIYRVQMPNITPHVCRHTYCSNMAKSGMNPKTLQYLMGHSDISVTMNVYTHIGFVDAEEELKRMEDR